MSSQTTTFPISLSSQPRHDEVSHSLSYLIGRINQDRGHLRNVTEDSLKDEIQKQQDTTPDAVQDDSTITPQDLEARQKELQDARVSMLQNVSDAHNQALLLLDSVSFLLKDKIPRAAESMSPALKGMFQQGGSLSYSMLPQPKPSEADIEQDNLVTLGLTLSNLNRTADSLLDSASKLESEVKKETQYWDDILSVREKGWPVCRVRGQRNTLGVRYGFPEASPVFAARSMAVMRPTEDGHIVLDSGVTRDPKIVRVRIYDGAKLLADCRQSAQAPESGDISTRILRARDSLFEEELFHDLEQEARTLLSYGVRVERHEIVLPLSLDALQGTSRLSECRRLVLSLESLQSDFQLINEDTEALSHARAFVLSLRLLLTNKYRKRFQERSRPPPALSLKKEPVRVSNMLRILITFIQHQSASSHIAKIIENTSNLLQLAKLDVSSAHDDEASAESAETLPPMERLLDDLKGPWRTRHTLKLAEDCVISVTVTTALEAPTYGSRYLIKTSSASIANEDVNYTLETDAIVHVNRNIRSALLDYVRQHSERWISAREISPTQSEMRRKDGVALLLGLQKSSEALLFAAGVVGKSGPHTHVWKLGQEPKLSLADAVKAADADSNSTE